ncbi:MAG: ATP-binding protein [Alphaproteobacteria bacterium]|nr:ATP-binding protein [Alphaproteobacteria bacterium]
MVTIENRPRPFNLVRWFALLSLIGVAATAAVSAYLLSWFMTHRMLERDADVSRQIIQSIVRAGDPQSYFVASSAGKKNPELERLFVSLSRVADVARANVYNRERTVVWSSDGNLIGRNLGANAELEGALRGTLVVEAGVVGASKKPEHTTFGPAKDGTRFVENYIPIRATNGRTVIGVIELYKLPNDLFLAIDQVVRNIWIGAVLAAAALFALLFWLARRANGIMQDQQSLLLETQTLAAVGEMAASVAHGIRNPLASIRSSAELMRDEKGAIVRPFVDDIMGDVDRVDAWVVDLLNFTRTDAFDAGAVEVPEIVANCLKQADPALRRRGVETDCRLSDDLPPVHGTPEALAQVLNCLIENAVDAMPNGGRLEVTAATDKKGNNVSIELLDTGTGVSEEARAMIFRPFATTKPSGLGLGLALSRRIIERCGGSLELANRPTGGAVAVINLPAVG